MTFSVRLFLLFNIFAVDISVFAAEQQIPTQLRETFLQAEQYIHQNRDAEYFNLANNLLAYPLYPYLHYQWLKKHLDDDAAVLKFLHDYQHSLYARILRQKWLVKLGNNQQWSNLISSYKHTDDYELQCFYAQAQYYTGQQQIALETAKRLWLLGKTLPTACETLFTSLQNSPEFNSDWVWQRFLNALQAENLSLSTKLLPLLAEQHQGEAEIWLKLFRKPSLIKDLHYSIHALPQAGLLFAQVIMHWSETDTFKAIQTWDNQKTHFQIADETIAETEKHLAMELATKHEPFAYERLARLPTQDNTTREWRIRSALLQQNWPQVRAALYALNDEEKHQDKWQYWLAKANDSLGDTESAENIYQQLAKNRSLYGFLAATKLKQNIMLSDYPVSIPTQDLDQLQQQPAFQAVAELLAIGRKTEAKRQWWFATAGLDQHGLMGAAKLAQRWQWTPIAIFTLAKANVWDDVELRFPLAFSREVLENAANQQLDPALIYGLIRQESAFDELADSPAGAKGLMQIMPKTAEQIAQDLKEDWNGENKLFNPILNVKFGSYYFRKLLKEFGGQYLLATAAYNAGSQKIKRWLPKNSKLPGDIWLESIPYKETRNYVSSVMFYTLIYQQRLHRNALKPTDLIDDIQVL